MVVGSRVVTFELAPGLILLLNLASGAVDVVGGASTDELFEAERCCAQLTGRGYMVGSTREDSAQINSLRERLLALEQKAEPHLLVVVGYSCDLACHYCFLEGRQELPWRMGDLEIRCFSEALDVIAPNGGVLTITGGEPLLPAHYPAATHIMELARGKGMKIEVVTNGTHLYQCAPELSRFGATLQVTIDGPPEMHDIRRPAKSGRSSFEMTARGIDAALSNNLRVILRVNIDVTNVGHLNQLYAILKCNGWLDNSYFQVYLYPMSYAPPSSSCIIRPESELADLLVQVDQDGNLVRETLWQFHGFIYLQSLLLGRGEYRPRTRYCDAIMGQYVFLPLGQISTCWWGLEDEPCVVGAYVPTLSLDETKLNEWRSRSTSQMHQCRVCKLEFLCAGGCAYKALITNQSIWNPSCPPIIEVLQVTLPHLIKAISREGASCRL